MKSSSVNRFSILDTVLETEKMVQRRENDKNLNGSTNKFDRDVVEEKNELHDDHGEFQQDDIMVAPIKTRVATAGVVDLMNL